MTHVTHQKSDPLTHDPLTDCLLWIMLRPLPSARIAYAAAAASQVTWPY